MHVPKEILVTVSLENIHRARMFGACPLRIALLETPGINLQASVGEFFLSLGNGWKYRTPLTAQRFILAATRGDWKNVQPHQFAFRRPFFVQPSAPRRTIWVHERKPRRATGNRKGARRG